MFVPSQELSQKLSGILGLKHIVDVDFSFHLDSIPRATVVFILDDIQANAVLDLLEDTKWGQQSG